MADKYLPYNNITEANKARDHITKLAIAKAGFVPDTIDDLTNGKYRVGSRCTFVREAIKNGTVESSGLADKILRRHWVMPLVSPYTGACHIKVDALVEANDGDTDLTTGDKIDLKTAVDKLPEEDWPDDAAEAVDKSIR